MPTCQPSTVLNPNTNRCVKRSGRAGKAVLSAKKTCSARDGLVLNPLTNRCVLRDGRVGRSLSKKPSKKKSPAKKSPAKKSPAKKSPAKKPSKKKSRFPNENVAVSNLSGPEMYAETVFLLKYIHNRPFMKTANVPPPSGAVLTMADVRRVRRGEAEHNVLLPNTMPWYQPIPLTKTSIKNKQFVKGANDAAMLLTAHGKVEGSSFKVTPAFLRHLRRLVGHPQQAKAA